MTDVAARLAAVRARLAAAVEAAGRRGAEVTLVAVSKRMPASAIRAAYEAGQRDFGENYVQELVAKAAELADLPDVRFHLVGHLQRNKARQVVQVASVVHTVHSAELARELGRRLTSDLAPAKRFGPEGMGDGRLPVLVEVNVGREPQKSGCLPEELDAVLSAIEAEPRLRLSGLMTVPPVTDTPAEARPWFDELAALRTRHGGAARLPELSMGMTADLEHAVAAGATLVRIGTAIFGERPPAPPREP